MQEGSIGNFGLVIAYLVPGFIALIGLSFLIPEVTEWLLLPRDGAPTVGGFLYVTLASLTAGLTASTVRWLLLDTLHHWTGLPKPSRDWSRLSGAVSAYSVLNEHFYRYYQAYGNLVVSVLFSYVAYRSAKGLSQVPLGPLECGVVLVVTIFYLGSRDTYRKYVERVDQLLMVAASRTDSVPDSPDAAEIDGRVNHETQ